MEASKKLVYKKGIEMTRWHLSLLESIQQTIILQRYTNSYELTN